MKKEFRPQIRQLYCVVWWLLEIMIYALYEDTHRRYHACCSRRMPWGWHVKKSNAYTKATGNRSISVVDSDPRFTFWRNTFTALPWRHHVRDSVWYHQLQECLFNCLLRRRSIKISNHGVTGLCAGNSPGPVNSPHKWPVTRKRFPFDDAIIVISHEMASTDGLLT